MDQDSIVTRITPNNDAQGLTLFITPMVTGSLSAICSANIIYVIWKECKPKGGMIKGGREYDRLIFGMSALDIINSVSIAFSQLPVPKGHPLAYFSIGNDSSCTAQGFMTQLGLGVMFYNCSLCVYFLSTLKDEDDNGERIVSWLTEAIMHAVPISYGVITALIAYFIQGYSASFVRCFITQFSEGCTYIEEEDIINCANSTKNDSLSFKWYLTGLWITLVFIFICATSLAIYVSVKKILEKDEYANCHAIARRTKKICFMYVGAFSMTFLPVCISVLVTDRNHTAPAFAFNLFNQLTYPSQGIFNCAVFHYRRRSSKIFEQEVQEDLEDDGQ